MRQMAAALSFALLTWIVALGQPIGAEEQPRARHDWQVRVEAGLLSAALDQAPAGEVFSAVAQQGEIVLRLDRTLLDVPLTDHFERLPLEKGLRRLIEQLRSHNFRIDFAAEAGREPRIKRVEILAASGPRKVQTLSAATGTEQAPNGVEKRDRQLNQGERVRFENNGGLPGVPKGLQRKAERKGKIPPGNAWRFERAAQILGTDVESLVKTDHGEAPSGPAGEVGGAR